MLQVLQLRSSHAKALICEDIVHDINKKVTTMIPDVFDGFLRNMVKFLKSLIGFYISFHTIEYL